MSSVPSAIVAALSAAVVVGAVFFLLRYYLPLRSTAAYLIIPVWLAVALPASVIVLVPIDLASGAHAHAHEAARGARGIWLPDRVLLAAWRITYWLGFALTWLILPLLGEYVDAGGRTAQARLRYALRSNARYQLTVVGCAAGGLLYVSLQQGVSPTSFKALIMALAYVWGLALAIYLMGHGLVALPRRFLRDGRLTAKARRLEIEAVHAHDRMESARDARWPLERELAQLQAQKHGITPEMRDWIEHLRPTSDTAGAAADAHRPRPAVRLPPLVTDRFLADLTRRLVRARHKEARFVQGWARLVDEAVWTQAVLRSARSATLDADPASTHRSSSCSPLTPYTRHLLHYRVLPALRGLVGGLLALASIGVVWSELVKMINPALTLVSLLIARRVTGANDGNGDGDGDDDRGIDIGLGGQLIASLSLLYMSACALTSIAHAKVWGNRALVRRQTYGESACWYASQVAKLTVPLAYNFLTFLPARLHRRTAFYRFLGRSIDLTPLGQGFDRFFPIVILLPVGAAWLGLYGRGARALGLNVGFDDEEEEDHTTTATATETERRSGSTVERGHHAPDSRWNEGRGLIEREVQRRAATAAGGASSSSSSSHPRAASLHTPTTHLPALPAPFSSSSSSSAAAAAATRRHDHDNDNNNHQDHVLSAFAHRVKNTFETALPAPRSWIQRLTRLSDDAPGARHGSSSGGGSSAWRQPYQQQPPAARGRGAAVGVGLSAPWTRWFGGEGGGSGGRIRL
ncbi:MAG: hypothetical protein M1826_000434 [Phylliscum demangeonii]|nr:MAG: hypothetical protein M1826_000434 [Phylliscum demangeonii]